MAKIRLISCGFKGSQILAQRATQFVLTTTQVFKTSLKFPLVLHHLLSIIDIAHELMLKSDGSFNEESTLVQASYQHFLPLLTVNQKPLLKDAIFSSYSQDVQNNVNEDKFIEIAKPLMKEIDISDQLYNLHLLFKANFAIAICGPINTGKSKLLELYNEVAPLINELPLEIVTIYPHSDSPHQIFGHVFNDLTLGQLWNYGEIQGALHYLSQFEKTHHRILRFDGEVTPEIVSFFFQFVDSSGHCYTTNRKIRSF